MIIFAALFQTSVDSVAQLVEHYTFNVVALGSNPSGITKNEKPTSIEVGFLFYKITKSLLLKGFYKTKNLTAASGWGFHSEFGAFLGLTESIPK